MRRLLLFCCVLVTVDSIGQQSSTPLPNPDEACKPYTSSVVWLADLSANHQTSYGTGFLISGDGLIATAAHVVVDKQTKKYRENISVFVPNIYHGHDYGSDWLSPSFVGSIEDALKHDVALLKVTGATKGPFRESLDHLELGEEGSARNGETAVIIGYPGTLQKKCELRTIESNVGYQIVYKGVSLGGLSGAPMISLESGKVVGLVNGWFGSGVDRRLPTGESYGTDVAAIRAILKKAQIGK